MSSDNFMLQDVTGALLAACFFPLFLFIPGLLLARMTDVLSFRQQPWGMRAAIATVLSISIIPIVTWLLMRFTSTVCIWLVYGVCWAWCLGFAFYAARQQRVADIWRRIRSDRLLAWGAAVILAWTGLAVLFLVDIQVGSTLYPSVMFGDYRKHIAVTSAISRAGIPPSNPSFFPGTLVPLFYYYFWFLICSLVDELGGSLIGPRAAVFGGTIWSGIGLMSTIVTYVFYREAQDRRNAFPSAAAGIGLVLVSGLDVLPAIARLLLRVVAGWGTFNADPEWWNEQITAWAGATLWVPHHVAGLVAGLTGLLLLRGAGQQNQRRRRILLAVMSGLAFASAIGLSIWVAFVPLAFLPSWLLISIRRRWLNEIPPLLMAGAVTIVTAGPFLLDLRSGNSLHTVPVIFFPRNFLFFQLLVTDLGLLTDSTPMDALLRIFGNLLLLPVNYFLEFGFFAVAPIAYWRWYSVKAGRQDREYCMDFAILMSSLFICTFFRSTIRNNDLGWRSAMFAQFILLLWSIPTAKALFAATDGQSGLQGYVSQFARSHSRKLSVLLVVGALTTAYDLTMIRVYPMFPNASTLENRQGVLTDDRFGVRVYAIRQAYHWIATRLPEEAIVQHNPDVEIEPFHGMYGDRQTVAADPDMGTLFGVTRASYSAVASSLSRIFSSRDVDFREVAEVCRERSIDVLVVKDTDPIWDDADSWVWHEEPRFDNEFVRVFTCGAGVR